MMHLVHCKDQGSQSLDDFYSHLGHGDQDVLGRGAKAMLDLIQRLRALPHPGQAYGLTSLSRLCLLAVDSYESPWYVIIGASDHHNYFIEYLMPEHLAPWPQAYVRGEARSEDDAVSMIVTAMKESEGWDKA